ncbi:Gti1/Pac2 family-domain-containing protein [Sparassis latifolia]
MQTAAHATIPALHLRDARDAHIVFEAVRLNVLPLITRRLTANERDQLKSGNVFVWEEAEHKQGGLERWTDGRRWSQSRMRGDYLFYEEKIETTPEEKAAKAARRARRTLDPFGYQPTPTRQDRPSKPDGLTKQTYSTHVYMPGSEPRKWHVVAYFTVYGVSPGDDYTTLPVVEDYEYLRNVRVPEGIYTSAKGNLGRVGRVLGGASGHEGLHHSDDHPEWMPASWSMSPSLSPGTDRPYSSNSSTSSSSSSSPSADSSTYTLSRHSSSDGSVNSLPRLSNVVPVFHLAPPVPQKRTLSSGPSGMSTAGYHSLTAEDRRALNSFRIVL